ncbi:MAG: DUF2183 domain-containing protein [Labilithrix sp.]|nr:DUF2183 domain-containing protein [Labilithrix sp.]
MNRTLPYKVGLALGALLLAAACGAADDDAASSESAQTTWRAPAEGSCEAAGMLAVANEATFDELDGEARLDRRAAENLVAARPFSTVREIDDVPRVGDATLASILEYARRRGDLDACATDATEIGVVSDLDETVIPSATPDLSRAPFPGVRALLSLLEHRNGGAAGDVHYVTARTPERVADVPAYLAAHGVPSGAIETGVSGVPWIAEAEKVRDIEAILGRTGAQRFVLLGDSSHRDPEVYKRVLAAHPDRVIGGFIHKVNATVSAGRVEGLHLFESYAEVAAILHGMRVITREEALSVMRAARDEGLALTDAEMNALLDGPSP